MRFPATPGWGPLVAVVCGRLPLLAAGPDFGSPPLLARGSAGGGGGWAPATAGCGPGCGSPPLLAGVRRSRRWLFPWGWVGGFSWCVCLWHGACARGVCAGVCDVCSCWSPGCGSVFCVCWCVCVCACVVCSGWFPRLMLAAGVGVGVTGVCRGWSLATAGGGS